MKSGQNLEKVFLCSIIWKLFSPCRIPGKFMLGLEGREGGREERNNVHLFIAFIDIYFPFLPLARKKE